MKAVLTTETLLVRQTQSMKIGSGYTVIGSMVEIVGQRCFRYKYQIKKKKIKGGGDGVEWE